ncbi:hypothetical protein GF323_01700 [Candidatus Woesearchaeota archaeon]|nr:hypothetical protein [Candidatus Woesearchaeota archaeon]
MDKIGKLELEIGKILERNKKVEADKAWETSRTRKILLFFLTYFVIVVFFIYMGLPNPFINSLVPAIAFLLSTMTIPIFRNFWLKHIYKR